METTRLRQNEWEIITTRFGGPLVESEIRTEHLSSTLAIVRRVVTFLETSTQVQLTAQNSISGTRWFQLVEIHWESKCRVLRLLPPLTANSQIRVVAKQSSKCSVMISTYWRSHISELPGLNRNPYPATASIFWKNSGLYRISWPVSTQARQLSTAIQVMLYGRLSSSAQPHQATQHIRVTVTAVPVVLFTWWKEQLAEFLLE